MIALGQLTSIRERSVREGSEEPSKSGDIGAGSSNIGIRLHGRIGFFPVSETQPALLWSTTEVDDKGQNQQTDDCDDLDGSEDELCLPIDGDGEDVQRNDDDNDDRDLWERKL